jgi:hypothetical protein
MIKRFVVAALAAVALGLLGLNVAGLFLTMRHPALGAEPVIDGYRYLSWPKSYDAIVTLREDQLLAAAARFRGETDAAYATRLTDALYHGMAHYWAPASPAPYHLRVPPYENYLLFAASYVLPVQFGMYEFYDPRKAIERGVGSCSQMATVLAHLLEGEGIDTRLLLFTRHTVVSARVDRARDRWWVLDPDYGVVIPWSMEEIRSDLQRVTPLYLETGVSSGHVRTDVLAAFGEATYRELNGPGGYHRLRRFYEPASYVLIWALPVVLLAAGVRLRAAEGRPVVPVVGPLAPAPDAALTVTRADPGRRPFWHTG